MAESDSVVSVVMALAASTINSALKMPALPTTSPKRRNMITPRIVSTQGVNTPPKVPNLAGPAAALLGAIETDAAEGAGLLSVASGMGGRVIRDP